MTVDIRPARRADADAVAAFLNRHMDKRIPAARWRRLFHPPWPLPADAPDHGRVAWSDGEVVGFIARIYAERMIDGRRELIANISSWYLRKDHRKGSLALRLYRELLEDRGTATYTALSIAERTYPLYDRWGFGMLDEHRWLWRRHAAADAGEALDVITDPQTIAAEVTGEQRQLLVHNRDGDLSSVLARTCDGDLLVVLSAHRKRSGRSFLDVLHVSRRDLFERCAGAIANRILPDDEAVLAADARFVPGEPRGAERIPINVPRRYLSERLAPPAIDMLYAEFGLLGLKPS